LAENFTTVALALGAATLLGWGYWRSRRFGKLGLLAWLQSLVLMLPWLLFFGLFAFGIYVSLISILLMLLGCTAIYIYLGRQLRAASQDPALRAQIEQRLRQSAGVQGDTADPTGESLTDEGIAVPSPLTADKPHPIPAEDLQKIRNIFGVDTFFATETIPYQEGAIFKGNLRADPTLVFERLSSKLTAQVGDRYRLFLVSDQQEKPVVIVLPDSALPRQSGWSQWLLALILLVATVATCFERGGLQMGVDVFADPQRAIAALPVALGLLVVLLAQYGAQWLMARRYQVRLSPPFFIPSLELGSFGSVLRLETYLKNRSQLFDIALAGPAVGGVLSLLSLIAGLFLSRAGGSQALPTPFLQGSVLVGTLARAVLGQEVQDTLIQVHPLAIVGWIGLVITALSLLPIGQLNGGRIVQAIYGRKIAGRISIVALILLGLAALANPVALYWAIVIVFLLRQPERPSQDELTEPDDTRATLCLLALFLMIATLLPLTPSLAGRLGIGG
jgi:membrane-associated protease RseP (regulator of RpoE activity)